MFKITCQFCWIEKNKVYKLIYKKYFCGLRYSTIEDVFDVFEYNESLRKNI